MFTAPSTCPARFALSSSPDRIQAGIGTLLFDYHNPVGAGFYADAQKWLRASAAQGNDKDEVLLGLFDMRDALLGNAEARRAEARDLLQQAANLGQTEAKQALGTLDEGIQKSIQLTEKRPYDSALCMAEIAATGSCAPQY